MPCQTVNRFHQVTMEFMNQKNKNRVLVARICLGMLFALSACTREETLPGETFLLSEETAGETQTGQQTEDLGTLQEEIFVQGSVLVHVCGAVNEPGVYELEADSRIVDAVEAAGGFAPGAASEYENLAAGISDGQKIYIPWIEDVTEDPYGENRQSTDSTTTGLVDINTADLAELMTLPGIGEAKAKAILSYRENGGVFSAVEDIMQVSGIKEAAFEKIKAYITVEP